MALLTWKANEIGRYIFFLVPLNSNAIASIASPANSSEEGNNDDDNLITRLRSFTYSPHLSHITKKKRTAAIVCADPIMSVLMTGLSKREYKGCLHLCSILSLASNLTWLDTLGEWRPQKSRRSCKKNEEMSCSHCWSVIDSAQNGMCQVTCMLKLKKCHSGGLGPKVLFFF